MGFEVAEPALVIYACQRQPAVGGLRFDVRPGLFVSCAKAIRQRFDGARNRDRPYQPLRHRFDGPEIGLGSSMLKVSDLAGERFPFAVDSPVEGFEPSVPP
jgi:hypothetical protein